MKNIAILANCIAIFLCNYASQAQTFDDLIGSWQIDVDQTLSLMSSQDVAKYDTLPEESQESFRSQLSRQQFIFNRDSTFLAGTQGGKFYDGAFYVDNGTLHLSFYSGASQEQAFQVGNGNLIFTVAPQNSDALIKRVYLVPQVTD